MLPFDKRISDDDNETRPQLENRLNKRNFLLDTFRHLIPQQTTTTKPEEQKTKQNKPAKKANKKQKDPLAQTLFGHLLPQAPQDKENKSDK